ncbi:hypothetical protein [Sphingorhabdus sp.]|uniref:hypothetical protein n=1 Tax=Sphingorhabdus sp. TaxID=1902408 RepID=UPI003983487E
MPEHIHQRLFGAPDLLAAFPKQDEANISVAGTATLAPSAGQVGKARLNQI